MSKGDLIIHLDLISCHFSDFFLYIYVCLPVLHVDVSFILYFATENRSEGCLCQFKYIFFTNLYIWGIRGVILWKVHLCPQHSLSDGKHLHNNIIVCFNPHVFVEHFH